MGSGASSATPCLAGFFALRCFSLITIWVTPESWAVKPITSLPHWFYTRILRVPKCFSPQAFSLTPKSAHNLGTILYGNPRQDDAPGPARPLQRSDRRSPQHSARDRQPLAKTILRKTAGRSGRLPTPRPPPDFPLQNWSCRLKPSPANFPVASVRPFLAGA